MRVIAGKFRGTRLQEFMGDDIRPTADRLRESIFNIIGPQIKGKRVLDLYAGTGAMGIEALSRGAQHAIFIDNNAKALDLIRRNIVRTKARDQTTIISWDIARNLRCLQNHLDSDLIFIDPPYGQGLIEKSLINLLPSQAAFGTIVVEHDVREPLQSLPEGITLEDQRRYGKTLVSFLNGVL